MPHDNVDLYGGMLILLRMGAPLVGLLIGLVRHMKCQRWSTVIWVNGRKNLECGGVSFFIRHNIQGVDGK